ncbi:MAG: xanthine dehydrogenase accessory protein XdhC [Pseudomonadota bacterium]
MSLDRLSLIDAVRAHGTVARVVVAQVKGSAPREPGASILVRAEGQSGTIGGGALEFEAARAARAMLKNPGGTHVTRAALGPALNQCCGGAVVLVTEVFDIAKAEAIPEYLYIRRVEGGADKPIGLHRAEAAHRGQGHAPEVAFEAGWLLEPCATPKRPLWIYGAGHVGRALVDVLYPMPSLAITWVDTGAERFPETLPNSVTQLVAQNPALLVPHAPENADHLVLTYSHALDLEICHALLSHRFHTAGLIGSATKWARFRSRLRQLGHGEARISQISCPIGDPKLGKHPQAIAVGVAAALLRSDKSVGADWAKDQTG